MTRYLSLAALLLILSSAASADERQLHSCIKLIIAVEEPAEMDTPRDIYRDCPHLPPLFDLAAPLGIELPEGGELTLSQLLDIRDALDSRHQPTTSPLDESRLQALLAETLVNVEPSLWERFMEWLNDWFIEEKKGDKLPEWLEWLNKLDISREQSQFIFNLSLALLVLMALGILFNELRRLPLSRAARAQRRKGGGADATPADTLPDWSHIRALPPRQQATVLLRHLLRLMQERELLPDPRARTAGECVEAVATTLPEARPAFAHVAEAADRGLFGREQPLIDEALLAEAEALRDRLRGEGR